MKKYVLFIILIIGSFSAFSQARILSGYFPNGLPGYVYYDTVKSLSYAHPLFAINDTTAGIDTSGMYVSSFTRNGTNDSIILSFLNGRRLAVLGGSASTGGGTATAAGANTQIQYNASGSFGASPFFTYKPTSIASAALASNLYVGNSTLTASASGDTLTGVDIGNPNFIVNPSGTTYSNTKQYAARIGGTLGLYGTYSPSNTINNASQTGFHVARTLSGTSLFGAAFLDNLVPTANGATLIGVKIQPTFTNGAFTGVTNTALDVSGNAVFANDIKTNTLSSTGMVSTNGTAVMVGQAGAPTIFFANGYGMIGTEQGAGGTFTGTGANDFLLRSFQARPVWIGNTTNGRQIKIDQGVTYFTQTTPATPAAGSVVEWWDGTNMKWKKSDGSTGIIY